MGVSNKTALGLPVVWALLTVGESPAALLDVARWTISLPPLLLVVPTMTLKCAPTGIDPRSSSKMAHFFAEVA